MRIENLGDAAQDLSGWQLRSDPAEGQPYDLAPVGSIGAGQKFFVFQGHLSPAVDPSVGYFRWGTDEIFNLRANDSSDYVRIVDAEGNTVDQRNCEGLPPGATPAPTTEFDPPPIAVVTLTPVATPEPSPAPVGAVAATGTPSATRTPGAAGGGGSTLGEDSVLPAQGGPPSPLHGDSNTLVLAIAIALMVAGSLMTTAGVKRDKPGS